MSQISCFGQVFFLLYCIKLKGFHIEMQDIAFQDENIFQWMMKKFYLCRFLSLFFPAKFAWNMLFKMPQFCETTHPIFKISKLLKSQRQEVCHFLNKWKESSFFQIQKWLAWLRIITQATSLKYNQSWPKVEAIFKGKKMEAGFNIYVVALWKTFHLFFFVKIGQIVPEIRAISQKLRKPARLRCVWTGRPV